MISNYDVIINTRTENPDILYDLVDRIVMSHPEGQGDNNQPATASSQTRSSEVSDTNVTDDEVNLIDLSNVVANTNTPYPDGLEEVLVEKQPEGNTGPCDVQQKYGKKKRKSKKETPTEETSDDNIVGQSGGSSNSSITCRICQLSESETGEPVKTADCHCKGYLDAIHRSCLLEWIRYKGTKVCEVCASEFSSVPTCAPRPVTTDERRQQELEVLFRQYARLRPLSRRKRGCVASLLLFFVVITGVSGMLTVNTDRHFRAVSSNPWSTMESVNQSYIVFSICLSFLLFCSALTFGTLLTWCTIETTYHFQRQRVWRRAIEIAASHRIAP